MLSLLSFAECHARLLRDLQRPSLRQRLTKGEPGEMKSTLICIKVPLRALAW
jgi:hypothetical protein